MISKQISSDQTLLIILSNTDTDSKETLNINISRLLETLKQPGRINSWAVTIETWGNCLLYRKWCYKLSVCCRVPPAGWEERWSEFSSSTFYHQYKGAHCDITVTSPGKRSQSELPDRLSVWIPAGLTEAEKHRNTNIYLYINFKIEIYREIDNNRYSS